MRLQDIMSPHVRTVAPEAPVALACQLMRTHQIRHLIVMEKGVVRGVISERDLGTRGRAARQGACVAALMNERVVSATPETTVRRAANLMRGSSVGCLPVMEANQLVGIVTISDLLDVVGGRIESEPAKMKRWTAKHRTHPRDTMPSLG